MSDYNRTTRECTVNQLHPELRHAIRGYFKEHELGDLDAETLICCETISEKKDFGGLASLLKGTLDTKIQTGMLLTSEWLIWVRKTDQSAAVLNAANLKEIEVKTYTTLFTKDSGLEIFGYIANSKGPIRGRIAMGKESAAQKFCEEVENAVSKLKPPPPLKKNLPKWLGGK